MPNSFKQHALALLFVLPFFATACSTKEPEHSSVTQPAPQVPAPNVESTILPGSSKDFQVNVGDTVHFDYNLSKIRPEDRTILTRQAGWLNKYPAVRVTIEGHCDERGTRAYNLALGARRAQVVKEFLISLGVASARIDTISYGKERPACSQSTEMCWAMNRRAVTVITSGSAISQGMRS